MPSLLAVLSLGFILGMRHATDSDHVVAVTTIVSKERSIRFAGLVGAVWGIGHTATILLVGGAIILFRVAIPARLGLALELGVGAMLVLLGVGNLLGSADALPARGLALGSQSRASAVAPLRRPFVIGVVHGLAGSAAVALLVLASVADARWALVYLALFGVGTILGMMLLTSVIALPFAFAAARFAQINRRMVQLTSLASIGLGIAIAYRISVVDGFFAGAAR